MKHLFIVAALFGMLAGATVAQAYHYPPEAPSPIGSDVFEGD
ncbi:hypothetical protein [Filomicrobium sp.]|nr:hypothetical protein [Filomicrobium sp.]